MNINEKIHGFTITRIVALNEIKAELIQMIHDNTGLELVWLKRNEENKSFGVAFTTLPWNDTGVFHIIEHSVLCGSDKYPVKEPFLELMKNSMNTFLNALTFPDKTVYPISSKNDKDFMNLTRVYLDAVFHPSIYSKPEIFHQEGWHYEFDEKGNPSYKGVVFNEMKGAFADADELSMNALNKALFPDTPYRFVSGGDPTCIPDLSYEEFIDSHRKFYSPSNAFAFVDGDVNIDEVLACMNDEYLCDFTKTERIKPAMLQSPVDGGVQVVKYEIGADENEDDKNRLTYGYIFGTYADREIKVALDILCDVLTGSNSAPLKKAILSDNLAEDISFDLMGDSIQPMILVSVRNFKKENQKKIEEKIDETFINLANNGLDHSLIEASMANSEFRMRERDFGSFPSGLVYAFSILESWQYGGLPEANLEVGNLFDELKNKMENGFFEQLIKDAIINNKHKAEVVLEPSKTEGEKRRKAEEDRIKKESATWDDKTIAKLKNEQEILENWQHSEDTPEQLATLPHLSLEDIDQEPENYPIEAKKVDDILLLNHNDDTNGIVYSTIYYDAYDTEVEDLPYLSLLNTLLGELKTKKHSADDIQKIGRLLCGGFSTTMSTLENETTGECKVVCCVQFSALKSKLLQALDYVNEVVLETVFDDENEVRNIIRQCKQGMFERIVMGGNGFARTRVGAQFYSIDAIDELTRGISYYQWLKNIDENWNWNNLVEKFYALMKKIYVSSRLSISVTSEDETTGCELVDVLKKTLPIGEKATKVIVPAPTGKRNEGIVIPADIAFAVRGGVYNKEYKGDFQVASRIIRLAYLWNVIRVQGGAYGTGISVRANGFISCHSYRDPNGAKSLESYVASGDFLKSFVAEKPDLTGYIIGCVSDASPLTTPRSRGSMAAGLYFRNVSFDLRCKRRKELLSATYDSVVSYADCIKEALEDGGICIIAGQNQIDKCQLDSIITL